MEHAPIVLGFLPSIIPLSKFYYLVLKYYLRFQQIDFCIVHLSLTSQQKPPFQKLMVLYRAFQELNYYLIPSPLIKLKHFLIDSFD